MFINNLQNKKNILAIITLGVLLCLPVKAQESYKEPEQVFSTEELILKNSSQYTNDGAVILLFHRFGEDKYPTTNITLQQLDNLIDYLIKNQFNVIKLSDAVRAIQSGQKLPDKAVVITIDDAFKSVYNVAYPKFQQNNFPFTLFVSSRGVNDNNPAYMSWDNIVEMAENGVEIQAHTVNHNHMTTKSATTSNNELDNNINQIEQNVGIRPTMFAYPYGEANNKIINMVKNKNIKAGFSQHSGVYNATNNQLYIPRFSINERWGTLKRLKLVLNTKSFKTVSINPSEPYITQNNPPVISIKVDNSIKDLTNLNCFRSDTGKISLEKTNNTFDMTFTAPFQRGRTRINCTLPVGDGTYRWLGLQYTKD